MERPNKRIRTEEGPTPMDIDTRYKRKAAEMEEPRQTTPMVIDRPFVFYPMPRLIRAEKMEN